VLFNCTIEKNGDLVKVSLCLSRIIFKLEEDENTALLFHLPKVFTETTVLISALGTGCRLVVALVQV
jgi:hypothetical protein